MKASQSSRVVGSSGHGGALERAGAVFAADVAAIAGGGGRFSGADGRSRQPGIALTTIRVSASVRTGGDFTAHRLSSLGEL